MNACPRQGAGPEPAICRVFAAFLATSALALFPLPVAADSPRPAAGPSIDLRFEGGKPRDQGGGSLRLNGGKVNPGGPAAAMPFLRLGAGEWAESQPRAPIQGRQGTISLWVRPDWTPGDGQSHTLLSMPWGDGRNGYMVLSWGWWEPTFSEKLVFVLNNEDALTCMTDSKLTKGQWTLLTVTWTTGPNPGCKLFVDGDKLAARDLTYQGNYAQGGSLYIGSDRGTNLARGRPAGFDLAGLEVWDRSWTETQVHDAYRLQSRRFPGLAAEKEWWRQAAPGGTRAATVGRDGRLVQNRAIFDETAEWATSELYANRLLARLQKAGFNILVPCVWHGRGAHYPSPVAAMDSTVQAATRGRDGLSALIRKAHEKGIEVHPWFTVVRREDQSLPEFFGPGVPEGAYDVHNPRFRDYIVEVMLDVVRRYEVDGINLDYIRAVGVCESPQCRLDYARKTGRDLAADLRRTAPGTVEHAAIRDWQDQALAELVGKFSREARKIRPRLVISVDGHPQSDPAKRDLEGRDEIGWADRGLIDVVFNMDYRPKPDLDGISEMIRRLKGKAMLIQLFANYDLRDSRTIPRSGEIVAGYASYARANWGANGLGYHMAKTLSDEQIMALGSGPFKEAAVTSWAQRKSKGQK